MRGAGHLALQLGVADRAAVAALALEVQGDLVAAPGVDVPVDAVDGDVECAALEPGRARDRQRAVLLRDGRLPPPPIARVFGMRFVEIEDGRFSVTCDPREAFFNPLGMVHGGLACTMLDTALGCVAHSTLPAGSGYTSIDITVSYLRPILPSAGTLTAA